MSLEESIALLKPIYAFASNDPFIYRHQWRVGDTVIWNNRGLIHSGRGYDRAKYRRLLQRSETSDNLVPA
jgi:alpha-ketoglutarate-dependent taurine dioxygenase